MSYIKFHFKQQQQQQQQQQLRAIEETTLSGTLGSTNLDGGRNFHDHCPKHGGREKTVIDTETQVQATSKDLSPHTLPPAESQVIVKSFI
jgi:hypothetical protein